MEQRGGGSAHQQASDTASLRNKGTQTGSRFRVLIAGGGTGGHVMPALAIARELRDAHGADVYFVGTARGLEARLVPEAGFPLLLVRVGQLNRVSFVTRLKTVVGLPSAVARCILLLWRVKPHVVLGVGGYASGPAMLAALALRIAMVAYEPNAVPGMVNRKMGRFVAHAAVAYPETVRYFRRAEVTGVPVRKEMFETGPLPLHAPRLLITAGSNGAKAFNDTMPLIINALLEAVPGLHIVHQTGERLFRFIEPAYRGRGLGPEQVDVQPFLTDMPHQLNTATLVLARAGSTVAELAAAGRPSLLVPFPFAADDHQTKNAEAMVRIGAAELLPQSEVTPRELLQRLRALLLNPALLQQMGQAARQAAKPDALRAIGQMLVAFRPRS